jgi:small conductance mechanosensitive channel
MDANLDKLQDLATVYGLQLLAALLILLIGRWVAGAVRKLVQRVMSARQVEGTVVSFVSNLAYMAILTFVLLAAISKLGVQTTSFVAVIGAAGLAIGLAFQSSLSNFASGFLLVIFRPFKKGDFIEGAGTAGIVEEVQIFTTRLVTPDNKLIIIPNSKLMGDNITNFSAKDTRRVDFKFGVSYGDDLRKVKAVLKRIVDEETRALKEPGAMIVVSELGDNSVNFTVRFWVKSTDYWPVFFATVEKVKLTFDAEGISIPFPQRDVHLYQEK